MSQLTIQATKPRSQLSRRLDAEGVTVLPADDPEPTVERYIVSRNLAIERRNGNSFVNGIMDKTLFTSAIYLREHFRLPVLIVEGDVDYEFRGMNPAAVRGALSSMMLKYELNVVTTHDLEDTCQLVMMMTRQEQVGIPEISLIPKRKADSLADQQRRLVEMLPGCGGVMARDLLQYFGSVARIARATEDELQLINGLGRKKAADMRSVLSADYEAADTEKQIEDAIEVDPTILFPQHVSLVARQLYIFDDESQRHIVDMVFADDVQKQIILVELKRDKLEAPHRQQLRRYLDHATEAATIADYLKNDYKLRGVLASPNRGKIVNKYDDIEIVEINCEKVIAVLGTLRQQRLASMT